ncbi:hypothetical protein CIPAW_15G120700 [Carya illinoinensis]|uniref:NB-ARC domain-containing protein n=1 Tax=Carya illinoinensis TaxID=32201 RepID=A0A8T1N6N0_CARIL|nr:hypothetical protein CIPAW_15G120700 [Carya illinoinensis]
MVGIFGVGGIGKTTFSKDIYNKISSQFEGSCFLSNIREKSKRGGMIKLQKRLLFEILGEKLDIYDADRGVNVIRDRLHFQRVLLILDDVDELGQLRKLAGDRAWLGLGSRIIVTTRDKQLLKIFGVDSRYELMLLDDNEALRLFSLHAFKKDEPLYKYVELSKQVIKYAQGLPLALTVLGSDLKNQSIHQWKSALDKYKSIPHKNIHSVLRISYDGLEDNEKEMFLDIAFFFNGEPMANVRKIFDIYKCLITIEDECVWMHDLLKDMGQEIVRLESPLEPGERSRLWFHEDIRGMLEESTMKRIRVLINRNARFSSGPDYLSNELRVLDWFEYPLQSLPPNFHGKKTHYLSNAYLVEVHDSIGSLENLFHLCFIRCSNLRIFPTSLKLRTLHELNLSGCLSLHSFPEIHTGVEELPLSIENLTGLHVLFLNDCKNLMRLPINIIILLQHLRELNIGGCTNLLKKMGDDRRNSFQSESSFFPISSFFTMFNFSATLASLDLSESEIVSLPTSIKGFVALIELYLRDRKKLEEILELPPNIANVFVDGCQSLERFPEVSRILEFNGSHNRSLSCIGLHGCDKMDEKIWNYKVPNPLLWKGHYNATVLLENEISEWLWYQKKFLENEIAKRGDDDVHLKGNEEWVINIEGPHYLEDISGIVIYAVTFFNEDLRDENFLLDADVTINSSNCICRIDTKESLCLSHHNVKNNIAAIDQHEVWMWYSDLESFKVKVLDNLRVQLCIANPSLGTSLVTVLLYKLGSQCCIQA